MPQPKRLLLPIRAAAGPGLEAEPAVEDASQSATTVVEVAINSSIIQNRLIQGSSSAHSTINNRCSHGSRSSGDIRSISSTILGPTGLDHLLNCSIEVERYTSGDNNIGEEISRIGTNRARAIAAARWSIPPQSARQLKTRSYQ